MDQEWILNKTRKIMDEFSTAELLFDKRRTDPPFVFKETDTMFILTTNLKGYKRDNIKVEINRGGKRVAVIGQKTVPTTGMVGNKVYTKEIETSGFKRAFHFSDGVILGETKAGFNERECVLTISIPKMKKGFRVTRVVEVKQEDIGGNYELLPIEKNIIDGVEILETEKYMGDVEENERDKDDAKMQKEELEKREIVQELDETRTSPTEAFKDKKLDPNEAELVQEFDENETNLVEDFSYQEFGGEDEKKRIEGEGEEAKKDECSKMKKKKCKLCNPIILGSTILVTISVIAIYLFRTQNPHRKKRN